MTSVSAFSLLCVRKVCLSLICDDVHFSPLFFSAVQQWLGALQRQHNFGVSHYSLSSGWWKRSLNKLWKSLKSSAFTTAMLFINMLVSINRCLQKRPKAAKIKLLLPSASSGIEILDLKGELHSVSWVFQNNDISHRY